MAITDTLFQASSPAALQDAVNTFLAALVDPLIVGWQIQAADQTRRIGTEYRMLLSTDVGGPALATPFLLDVLAEVNTPQLQTALAAYRVAYAGQFISAAKFLFIPDQNVTTSMVVAAFLRNTAPGASANYTIAS